MKPVVGSIAATIEASANDGAKGIVSAGTGRSSLKTPLRQMHQRKGMLTCLCNHVASDRVVRSPGLQRRGFVANNNPRPWKARLLLALALTITTNADEIQNMFDTY
jgi:L-asparaginase/Glu-tRNA(Gln) amidotransferase subunit D